MLMWEKVFGDVEKWDDPIIIDKLRKEAIAWTMRVLAGDRVKYDIRKTAEFVISKFVATQSQPHVQIHISWKDIEAARKKTGEIKPINMKQIIEASPVKVPS